MGLVYGKTKFQTADMIAVRSRGPVAWGIRWITDLRNSWAGAWVANHIAFVVRRSNGLCFVYESLGSRGVVTTPLVAWLRKHKDIRIYRPPHLTNAGKKAFKATAEKYEGRKYEHPLDFLKIIFGKNTAGDRRLFCSEYYARCAYEAAALRVVGNNFANITPDYLTDLAERLWERVQ